MRKVIEKVVRGTNRRVLYRLAELCCLSYEWREKSRLFLSGKGGDLRFSFPSQICYTACALREDTQGFTKHAWNIGAPLNAHLNGSDLLCETEANPPGMPPA